MLQLRDIEWRNIAVELEFPAGITSEEGESNCCALFFFCLMEACVLVVPFISGDLNSVE